MDRETLYRIGMYGAAVLVGVTTSTLAFPAAIKIAGTSLSGVIGGMLANELGALNNNSNPDLRNAHLTRATGNAIAIVIHRTVEAEKRKQGRVMLGKFFRDRKFLADLEAFAQTAQEDWQSISQEILKQDNFKPLDEQQLAEQYFSTAAPNFETLRALARWEDWLPVLEALKKGAWERRIVQGETYPLRTLQPENFEHLAKELHEQFPLAIREELKKDFAQGKEAFAGMIFDLLGNLTQEVKAIRKSGDFSAAEAKKLDAMLGQLQQYEKREKKQFKALAKQVNAVLDSVIQQITQEHEQTRQTVEQQHEITRKQTQDALEQGFTRLGDKIDKIDPKRPISAHPPTNLSLYSRPVAKFVGRDTAISELSELLQSSETVAIAAAVSGMGGLGKTELAWQWAQQQYQQGNFPGGVVWLDMAAGNPEEQLLLFCQIEFAVKLPDFPTLAERIAYCWQHWQEWRTGEVLIVLDDVARDRDAEKLHWFQPGKSQFRVLWTTRDKWTKADAKHYSLGKLLDTAARELLASYLDEKRLNDEPEAVAHLLAWFEGLPLGLELAARYLALDEFLPIADYVRELSLTHESLEPAPEMSYPHGVEAALALSWARLNGDKGAEARELAITLSLFGSALIPLPPKEQKAWHNPLKQLVNLHLLEREREAKNLVRLHPLVRQFFQAQLMVELTPENADELRRAVAGAIIEQGKQIPYRFTMAQAREFAPWIPHLEEVAKVLLPWVADESLIWPLTSIARYYNGQGLYSSAEPWSERCLAVARERLGDQHPDTATALDTLANLYQSQDKCDEAEALYKKAIAIDRESLSPNRPNLATSLNNLADLYKFQGKYNKAEPRYLEAIAIYKETLPPNHPNLANSLNNLADLYRSQGKYTEAEPLLLEAIAIDRESLPPNHPSLARDLNNLAFFYESQENYKDTEPLYLEAIEIVWESLGEDHPDTQTVLNNVIRFYQTALAAGLPDTDLRQHPLSNLILSRLES